MPHLSSYFLFLTIVHYSPLHIPRVPKIAGHSRTVSPPYRLHPKVASADPAEWMHLHPIVLRTPCSHRHPHDNARHYPRGFVNIYVYIDCGLDCRMPDRSAVSHRRHATGVWDIPNQTLPSICRRCILCIWVCHNNGCSGPVASCS